MSAPNPDAAASAPAPGTVRRRDVLVGGLAGLAGLGGGAAVGRATAPPRPAPPGDAPPPAADAPPPARPADLPEGAHPSYAQGGEDRILEMMIQFYGLRRPTYMDIGSYDPVVNNNTYILYAKGSRGLLVEPNPALSAKIRAARPGDVLLAAGIGVSDATEADYYMFNTAELNTFDPAQRDKLVREGVKLEHTVKVPLVDINRAIAEHLGGRAPDILSIDIEGLDLAVLRTLDFGKYRPQIICAETLITLTRNHNPETTPFMASRGYEVRAMTFPNTFYVDRRLLG